MAIKLSGPMVAPENGVARQAMVLLHGYGSDGNDLIGLVPYFRDLMPEALFVAPNAPHSCAINPIGFEWFAIDHAAEVRDFSGIQSVREDIAGFLEDLWAQTGIAPADTILCGFSQGAMIALDTGLHLEQDILGIVAFSGGISPAAIPDIPPGRQVPVCLVHGDADDVVPVEMSQRAESVLAAAGVRVTLHISPGMGHGIGPDAVEFTREFIAGICATKSS